MMSGMFKDFMKGVGEIKRMVCPNVVSNPSIPYVGEIYEGVYDDKEIIIMGRPTITGDSFSINLACSDKINPRGDTAFHFNPRFKEHCVVRNHFRMGSWGSEEKHGGFPFRKGQSFMMKIVIKPKKIKVFINDDKFCKFEHRISLYDITHLTIEGSIDVSNIQYGVEFQHGNHMQFKAEKAHKHSYKSETSSSHKSSKSNKGPPSVSQSSNPYQGPPGAPQLGYPGQGPPSSQQPSYPYQGPPNPQQSSYPFQGLPSGQQSSYPFQGPPSGPSYPYQGSPSNQQPSYPFQGPPSAQQPNYPSGGGDGPIYNPPVPFTTQIPGNFNPNQVIMISGSLNSGCQRFTVNMQCGTYEGSDIAFHFDVRMNESKIVRNSLISGSWGSEETWAPYFPFSPNGSFDIMIMADHGQFKVAVNNQHFLEYNHRIQPLNRISTLVVQGDVRLNMVRFQ